MSAADVQPAADIAESILRKLAGGMTVEEILADHPRLTADDVFAAAEFAA